jgi:hypothetical protein
MRRHNNPRTHEQNLRKNLAVLLDDDPLSGLPNIRPNRETSKWAPFSSQANVTVQQNSLFRNRHVKRELLGEDLLFAGTPFSCADAGGCAESSRVVEGTPREEPRARHRTV